MERVVAVLFVAMVMLAYHDSAGCLKFHTERFSGGVQSYQRVHLRCRVGIAGVACELSAACAQVDYGNYIAAYPPPYDGGRSAFAG